VTTVPTLDGVFAKVVRAYQHLQEFHKALGDFQDGSPYASALTLNENPELVDLTIRPVPFPAELPILLGDWAHNLRSALDHLAWQLVIDHGGNAPNKHTSFPIFLERLDERGRERNIRITPKVSDDVLTFIKEAQPFNVAAPNDPRTHTLGALAQINNIDKHRQLPFIRGAVLNGVYAMFSPNGPIISAGDFNFDSQDGAVIATVPRSQVPPDVQVNLVATPAISLDIGNEVLLTFVRNNPEGQDVLRKTTDVIVLSCILPLIEKMKRLQP
jgi:hypothetical protein